MGALTLYARTVHIRGTGRMFRLTMKDSRTVGTLRMPWHWGWFTYGGYLQLTIVGDSEQHAFEIAFPTSGHEGAVGCFRPRGDRTWARYDIDFSSRRTPVFPDDSVIHTLDEDIGRILMCGLMSVAAYPEAVGIGESFD